MRVFRSSGSLRARALVPLVAALLVWTSITSVVTATAVKSFHATISPTALAAGGSYGVAPRDPIILTITNMSTQAQMGSANVALPAGLKLTTATATSGTATATANLTTNTVELRNLGLQPGGFVTATVAAQVECASNNAPYIWTFEVKQANDFNGTPGNDLVQDADVTSSITGQCGLSFTKQPKSEEKNIAITNKIYDVGTPQTGDPVTVSVVDAEGSAVPWWSGTIAIALGSNPGSTTLGGTPLSKSTTTGSATFTPQISVSATGYTLAATAVATAGTPSAGIPGSPFVSDAFTIVDDATICLTAGSSCMVTASGPDHGHGVTTEATVTAGANVGGGGGANDLVILQVGDPATDFNCPGYVPSTDVIAFNATLPDGITPVLRVKTSQIKLFAQFVTKTASKYDVCYRSSGALFTPKGGGPQVTQGLLPNCAAKNPVAPCIVLRDTDRLKNVILTVLSPAGDPVGKF